MSKTYTQINPATDTFSGWLAKVNSLLADMNNVIITTNNDGSTGLTDGNAHINGILSAVQLRATTLSGGNTINGDNLIIASNTSFSGTATFANTIVGSITGSANTANRLTNPVVISLTGDLTGNTVFSGNNNVSIASTANTSGNILTKSGNLSGLANTATSRVSLGLGSVATRDVSLNVDFTVLPDAIPARSTVLTMTNTLIAPLLRPMTVATVGDVFGSVSFSASNTSPVLTLTANTSGNLLTKSDNLSGLANTALSRTNLGVSISSNADFTVDSAFLPTRNAVYNLAGMGEIGPVSAIGSPLLNIPLGMNTIEIFIDSVISNTAQIGLQLGTSSGIETTGYDGLYSTIDGAAVNGGIPLSNMITIWTTIGAGLLGVIYLKRLPGLTNSWFSNYVMRRSGDKTSFGAAKKVLIGQLDRIIIGTSPGGAGPVLTNTITSGTISVRYSK